MRPQKININLGEALVPGLSLIFGIAYLFQTIDASLIVMRWPYIIGGITAALWFGVVIVYVFTQTKAIHFSMANLQHLSIPALMVIGPLIYLITMPYLGFAVSTMIFLLTSFRMLGSHSWRNNLLIALSLTIFLHVALVVFMHMPLPRLEMGSFVL